MEAAFSVSCFIILNSCGISYEFSKSTAMVLWKSAFLLNVHHLYIEKSNVKSYFPNNHLEFE